MDFVVIDVETANADLSSICQVGIASFCNGGLADTWESLVNPEDYFSSVNISIHGIDEYRVENAPTWTEVFPEVATRLGNKIVVSHTPFDRRAVESACQRSDLQYFDCRWLDSARVVRIAWPEFRRSGYGLTNIANHFGIQYRAHDALEDARCAGLLLLRAIAETGIGPDQWLAHTRRPIHLTSQPFNRDTGFANSVKRVGNPDGPLFGEIVVFTGSLSISRENAATAAAQAGCCVDDGVTKHTTMLVVGDQDLARLAGHNQSSKFRKAEQLISKGQHIRILGESDFARIVSFMR